MMENKINRRGFISFVFFSAIGSLASIKAFAQKMKLLDPHSPEAKKYNYVVNNSPSNKKQFCKNCSLYKSIHADSGSCPLFKNNLVTSTGWCSTWMKRD